MEYGEHQLRLQSPCPSHLSVQEGELDLSEFLDYGEEEPGLFGNHAQSLPSNEFFDYSDMMQFESTVSLGASATGSPHHVGSSEMRGGFTRQTQYKFLDPIPAEGRYNDLYEHRAGNRKQWWSPSVIKRAP